MARTDIYFAADDAHAFLPWIIGIMVCMATLLLCLGMTLNHWIVDRHDSYSNSFTVNVPAATDDMQAKLGKIRDSLQKLPGVTGVTQVADGKLRDMLKPWLGNGAGASDLPLPAVLDVTLSGNGTIDYKDVQEKLAAIAPGTEVDAHELWIANFTHFSAAMQGLIGGLAAVIMGGLGLIIAFTSRASLKLHARSVALLHSIGAEDRYITRQFQWDALWLTLRGTIPGCLFAGLAYWAAGAYLATLEASMLPSLTMTWPHLQLLVVMPLFCAFVAWLAARYSVIKQLQHVL